VKKWTLLPAIAGNGIWQSRYEGKEIPTLWLLLDPGSLKSSGKLILRLTWQQENVEKVKLVELGWQQDNVLEVKPCWGG
jgi:hypothetical protein